MGVNVVTHTVMNVATLGKERRDARFAGINHLRHRSLRNHLTALCAGTWPHLDEIIGFGQHPSVMIDHYHGIAISHQVTHDTEQYVDIRGMQPNRRLIQHI